MVSCCAFHSSTRRCEQGPSQSMPVRRLSPYCSALSNECGCNLPPHSKSSKGVCEPICIPHFAQAAHPEGGCVSVIVKWWGADDLEEVKGEIDRGANSPANQCHAQGMCLFTNEHQRYWSPYRSRPHKSQSSSHSKSFSDGLYSPRRTAIKSSS